MVILAAMRNLINHSSLLAGSQVEAKAKSLARGKAILNGTVKPEKGEEADPDVQDDSFWDGSKGWEVDVEEAPESYQGLILGLEEWLQEKGNEGEPSAYERAFAKSCEREKKEAVIPPRKERKVMDSPVVPSEKNWAQLEKLALRLQEGRNVLLFSEFYRVLVCLDLQVMPPFLSNPLDYLAAALTHT